jgi:cell division cycle protein 20 (cofactor of APC complex)
MNLSISDSDSESSYNAKCSECAYKALIQENLTIDMKESKVLKFKSKAEKATIGLCSELKEAYMKAQHAIELKKKTKRRIPRKAERILDAPELLDDYYLSLVDWSARDKVAVCLGHSLYLWDSKTGNSDQLLTHDKEHAWNLLTAVAWAPNGTDVAVGCADRSIEIWDVEVMRRKAVFGLNSHEQRISALAWNFREQNILTSGSRDTKLCHHDIRNCEKPFATLSGHTQEVCGLKWSLEGMQLASGGNDNSLCIWDIGSSRPRFIKQNFHQAAVKALAWCPWKSNLLATGGGTADKSIKFWDSLSGECLKSYQTESQVCSMLFNPMEKELVTAHGFMENSINVWRYPTMEVIAELKGHKSRVLCMAMSPDGTTIVSGSADETLRFWKLNAEVKLVQKLANKKQEVFGLSKTEIR